MLDLSPLSYCLGPPVSAERNDFSGLGRFPLLVLAPPASNSLSLLVPKTPNQAQAAQLTSKNRPQL